MHKFLKEIFSKNHNGTSEDGMRGKYGVFSGLIGIFCNIFLCVIKIVSGIIIGSIAVIADGLNNLSDIGSSLVTVIGFRLAAKPADRKHPFGHGRMEYMAAFTVSVLILILGFELLINSVKSLVLGANAPHYSLWTLLLLAISVAVKFFMFLFNRNIGKKINSASLLVSAQDSINDCIATVAIIVAAVLTRIFDISYNLDAVMAIGVAVFIIYSGIITAKDTIDKILGSPPDKALIEELENQIIAFDGFLGIHDLIVHSYGPERQFASVHVEVPRDVDIVKCHEQIDLCEMLVAEKLGVELVIHVDPTDVNNETVNLAKSQMQETLKGIDKRLSLHDFRMVTVSENRINLIFDVVVPDDIGIGEADLEAIINNGAKRINPGYFCIIKFDNDFTGRSIL